ncbi:MAG: endopeptidase La [Deltaproteobacteria bacterium]|nr:endopeptidase La [Deltaproteobacteria bacterium]
MANKTEKVFINQSLPVLPLRDILVFPHMIVPLFVGRDKSIRALEVAMEADKNILLSAQKDAKVDEPTPDEINDVGTLSSVLQMLRLPDGTVKVLVEGQKRCRLTAFRETVDYFSSEYEELDYFCPMTPELEALMRSIVDRFERYAKLNKKVPQEVLSTVNIIEDPGKFADTIAAHLLIKLEDKQDLLEAIEVPRRLENILQIMESEIEILRIERKIRSRVKRQMERTQKEYYLNEQMRAIQKELGEKDEAKAEVQELEEKIKDAQMPEAVNEKALKELRRLKMMAPMAAEATVVRNYMDWLISIPWTKKTDDKLDITEAERILNEDHYGLHKVKDRILEYLAVHQLVGKLKGPILCFVGPPGVGKTSLAKSIARSMGRNFVRLSLGGVRDEAEIRGHRRTYIGALPGRIIQSMKRAETVNPLFLLDEVDKMSMDFRGDPSSALLEVLDPEQNNAFSDHYLEVDYDLSNVMFITTANTLDPVPAPLRDRMEIIRIAGYTEPEKLNIAKQFLVKKQLKANGLSGKYARFTDAGLLTIIRNYTMESGVRNLEREIASVFRKVARDIVKAGKENAKRISINSNVVKKYLGVPKYDHGLIEEKDRIGLTTGLAWTEVGGELLQIEVTVMEGKGNLTLTGKLGDVMQESARAALSYVRSRASELGLPRDFYQKVDIHVHVPEGAIPKDGPSAGITLATSLASALTGRPVRHNMAMTGEITLRGRVLKIGGLKEKLLAANRGGVTDVTIPRQNRIDLTEVPVEILQGLTIHDVESVDEVLELALLPRTEEKPIAPLRGRSPQGLQDQAGPMLAH